MRVRQAVFLVGGKGTRLGAIAQDTPKPLLEIAPGLRFLDVLLEEAARHGFDDLLLLAGHLGDLVEQAYQGRTIRQARVRVLREPGPMGTGGALRFAADALSDALSDALADAFLMGNGDSLFEANLRALCMPLPGDAMARLALRMVDDPARFGAVDLAGDRIVRFLEKDPELKGPALINGGLYMMRRDVLGLIEGPCSIEQDVFPKLAARGQLQGVRCEGYFLDIGLPDTYAQARAEIPARRRRPCAFLDRDGTINQDHGYTHLVEDLVLLPGVANGIRQLNEAGHYVIVVTNQAGIGRGLFAEADMARFHEALQDALALEGAHIDAFYHCPFHAEAVDPDYRVADHPDRKPNPGMILRAMQAWPIAPEGSFLMGDMPSDLEAARRAGLPAFQTGPDTRFDVIVAAALSQVQG